MNLVELLQIASYEEKAEEFLKEKGVLKAHKELDLAYDTTYKTTQSLDSVYINLSQKMVNFYQEK
jgi:hypothetical protein